MVCATNYIWIHIREALQKKDLLQIKTREDLLESEEFNREDLRHKECDVSEITHTHTRLASSYSESIDWVWRAGNQIDAFIDLQ